MRNHTFRKLTIATFAAIMAFAGLASANEAETTDETEMLCGAYETNEDEILSEEAEAVFNKAAETSGETDLTPMAVLSTQIVSGTNYRFLALKGEEPYYVTVYADLNGNAEISEEEPVTISEYQEKMVIDLLGQYQDSVSQRASLYLETDTKDRYNITIDWGNTASSTYEWTMTCVYVPEVAKFIANDVSLVDINAEGNTELYKDGKAAIHVWEDEDGKVTLRWNDAQEDAGEDCIFEKVQ